MFYSHFCAQCRLNGPSDLQGNEVKSKMKQPSDMPTPRFKHGGSDLWSNTPLLDHGGPPRKIMKEIGMFMVKGTNILTSFSMLSNEGGFSTGGISNSLSSS